MTSKLDSIDTDDMILAAGCDVYDLEASSSCRESHGNSHGKVVSWEP